MEDGISIIFMIGYTSILKEAAIDTSAAAAKVLDPMPRHIQQKTYCYGRGTKSRLVTLFSPCIQPFVVLFKPRRGRPVDCGGTEATVDVCPRPVDS